MISTKQVNADDKPKAGKLNIVTTKGIDASFKALPEEERKKNETPMITTHDIEDVAAIAAKKVRDEIQADRDEFQKKLDAQKRMAKARAARGKK